jgi:hypothetical protein
MKRRFSKSTWRTSEEGEMVAARTPPSQAYDLRQGASQILSQRHVT